jgi:hypothetical protein
VAATPPKVRYLFTKLYDVTSEFFIENFAYTLHINALIVIRKQKPFYVTNNPTNSKELSFDEKLIMAHVIEKFPTFFELEKLS